MKTFSRERVNADIYRAISTVLISKAGNPAFADASILRTELSLDGSVCNVFVTAGKEAFEKSAGFFRTEIAKMVNVRRMPRLAFIVDKGQKNADRIEELLAKISSGGKK